MSAAQQVIQPLDGAAQSPGSKDDDGNNSRAVQNQTNVTHRAEQLRDTTREIVFEEVILPMGHYPEEKLKLIERDLL